MINQGYTEGVRVVHPNPFPFQTNVDVSSEIIIKINTNINSSSIIKGVKLLDAGTITPDETGTRIVELFGKEPDVDCISTYNATTNDITLKPKTYLLTNHKYIIVVDGLVDIYGNTQVDNFISIFYTGELDTLKPPELLSPHDNSVIDDIPLFRWTSRDTNTYIFEVSKQSTFDTILYRQNISDLKDTTIDNVIEFKPELVLNEGPYFWRVKCEDSNFSVVNCFYYNLIDTIPVTEEDKIFQDASIKEFFELDSELMIDNNIKADKLFDVKNNMLFFLFSKIIPKEQIQDLIVYNSNNEFDEVGYQYSIVNTNSQTYLVIFPNEIKDKKEGE